MNTKKDKLIPLTKSQLSLLAGQRMHPQAPMHNVVYTFDISGAIDAAIFEKAFQELIRQTDVLRTVLIDKDGTPYLRIDKSRKFDLRVVDFNSKIDETSLAHYISEFTKKHLNLEVQVFDTALIKVSNSTWRWVLKIHHVMTDAVSYTILYRRMAAIYAALIKGETPVNVEHSSFEDYVNFEYQLQNDPENESYRTYWHEKTSGTAETAQLYGEKADKQSTAARRITINIGRERSDKLREMAKLPDIRGWTEDLTIFNIFSSIYFSYLYRITGQKKLMVSAPAHNRGERIFQDTAGLFLEVLPMVTEIDDNETFNSLLQKVKVETNSYLRNVRPGMSAAIKGQHSNTVLNYFNIDFGDFNGFKTETNWIHNEHIDNTHELRCHVYDLNGSGEFKVAFDLKESLFSEQKSHQAVQHFVKLLDSFLTDINIRISEPNLLATEELKAMAAMPLDHLPTQKSAIEIFENHVANRPNTVALHDGTKILTYAELNARANKLAHYLKAKYIGASSKVILDFYRSSDYIISVLAVMKLGATFIPIASEQPAERIEYVLKSSGCTLLLTERHLADQFDSHADKILNVTEKSKEIELAPSANLDEKINLDDLAYILFTSGSTGKPKGVKISNKSLLNYLSWAQNAYEINERSVFALFTSIGFDLTITSTLLPLIQGARMVIYRENSSGPDTALLKIIEENIVNTVKLTPSHLALLSGKDLGDSNIETMIVGGEDFKVSLARSIKAAFPNKLKVFNEYGPTEATVGCIVSQFNEDLHDATSVPIGHPIANMQGYILDENKHLVPQGVIGELFLGGIGLADGYLNSPEQTKERFIENPFRTGHSLYRTGDLARINKYGAFEYLGRTDDQVKLRGYRIELSDIEANLVDHQHIDNCAVVLVEDEKAIPEEEVVNCSKCGLPSNYPNTDFDQNGVCHLCTAFENYKEKADRYFKNDEQLVSLLTSKRGKNPTYDCISLLSGGKDSTYVLARLIDMGLKVLAFTMDNGYISDQAKANIDRIVARLNVDHVYGQTPHMNDIFVDSLKRHHNVCNGCFKTIYTLSTKIALEKKIPFIVTGLSRGQFFETRLTEELFWDDNLETEKIDNTILEARKLYHQESDAVKQLLDTSIFDNDETFDKVEFVDFYRFSDVSLEEMLVFLKDKAGWVRPTDTGRSTNCLINQVGIYVHKKEMGYSNYSFPYSWDVRLGHKTRDESLEEINEVIDEVEVKRIMAEIGYDKTEEDWANNDRLVAYYTGDPNISVKNLKSFLTEKLPSYMVPTIFKHLNEIPLTKNGKVDRKALKNLNSTQLAMDTPYTAPRNEIEELLEAIWKEVLQLKKIGIHDDFIALGGHSLAAIRVTARINEEVEFNFPLNKVFELPTIAEYSKFIEETLTELMES